MKKVDERIRTRSAVSKLAIAGLLGSAGLVGLWVAPAAAATGVGTTSNANGSSCVAGVEVYFQFSGEFPVWGTDEDTQGYVSGYLTSGSCAGGGSFTGDLYFGTPVANYADSCSGTLSVQDVAEQYYALNCQGDSGPIVMYATDIGGSGYYTADSL